jgi:hypothetical protein
MSDEDIIKWLLLLGRGWVVRHEVHRVIGWDVVQRQEAYLAGWLDHNAEKEFDNESHYMLGPKALDRLNKVHERELSYV